MRSSASDFESCATGVASSARTVQRSGVTSAKPPATKRRSVTWPFSVTVMMPPRSATIIGEWPGRTPISPSAAGITAISTGRLSSRRSGLTSSSWKVAMVGSCPAGGGLRRRLQALALLHRVLDRADHVEGRFRQVVVLARDDRGEAADRVLELHEHARGASENLGDMEGLAEEALDLARARH